MTARRARGWGGRRKGAGRKPIAPAERRRHAVLLRISLAELQAIEAAAAGEPLATWLRGVALRAAGRLKR